MSIFRELVGQDAAVRELQRAADAARGHADEVSRQAMSQAWLFTGPPGSGRALAARTLAGALLCTGKVAGCGECAECIAVLADNHPDVSLVTTDLVTITAEEVREYVAQSYVMPTSGKWRVFIIEDADRMLTRTTNVLLKAIEEPGARTVWMLCTAAAADVLPTIRSRCRNVNLVTPSVDDVARLLVDRDGVDPQQARIAARASQSHIGVARALATDPQASAIRTKTLSALVKMRGVGDAAIAAAMLADVEGMRGAAKGKSDGDAAAAAEAARLEAMGLDPDAKIPPSVRSQVRESADQAKRRETRAARDVLDREMLYMLSFYRDVLACQIGSDVDLINVDFAQAISDIAAKTTMNTTLKRMDTIMQGRERLRANVAPQLVLEGLLVELRNA